MSSPRRVDLATATLAWVDAGTWKRTLREESMRRFAELPPAERLRLALEMVLRHAGPRSGAAR
jgi:hypothetical protein